MNYSKTRMPRVPSHRISLLDELLSARDSRFKTAIGFPDVSREVYKPESIAVTSRTWYLDISELRRYSVQFNPFFFVAPRFL